jgi:hypothetical protein
VSRSALPAGSTDDELTTVPTGVPLVWPKWLIVETALPEKSLHPEYFGGFLPVPAE